MLESLRQALEWLPEKVTPQELKDRFPQVAPLIVVAVERGGRNWPTLLAIIVAVIIGYVAHTDSQEAIQVAKHAAEKATEQTVQFSDREIEHFVSEAVTKLFEQLERPQR